MRFRFVIREILIGFKRNWTMVSAVILVSFISFLAIGSAMLIQVQVGKLNSEWYNKVEVSVWLCMDDATETANCPNGKVTQDQIDSISSILNSQDLKPYIKEVSLQSKESVYADFQKQSGSNSFSGVTADSFGPIFHIKLNSPDYHSVIQEALGTKPGVYEVVDQSSVFAPLFSILNKMQVVALFAAGILLIVALLLISTTIKLSTLNRKKEIEIMRLVGASNLFIQLPFVLEGAVAALLGSFFAFTTLAVTIKFWLSKWMSENFNLIFGQIKASDCLTIAPVLILIAAALSLVSSIWTLRKFTRV